MSDRRIVVVAEMLDSLPPGMDPERVAVAIVAALDADARSRPFIGIVPPVRALNERDTPGVYPGLDEFHKDTSHHPEGRG